MSAENSDLKDREAKLITQNECLQTELWLANQCVQEFNSLSAEASQLRSDLLVLKQAKQNLAMENDKLQGQVMACTQEEVHFESDIKDLQADLTKQDAQIGCLIQE